MKSQAKLLLIATAIASVGMLTTPAQARQPMIEACNAHWQAPTDAREGAASAMLPIDDNADVSFHADSSLRIVAEGRRQVVPDGIGVDRLTGWVSPLSTHGCDGVVRIQASEPLDVHLWQLFEEWGVRLTQHCIGEYCNRRSVAIVLNGRRVEMCPGAISLAAGTDIELEV